MNKHVKLFLHRGLIFGGFGPIITSIVFFFVDLSINNFSLNGNEILIAVISTYMLAFVQAGASVFNQIEDWPITKSLLCHFSILFVAYSLCYIVNSWIPFKPIMLISFFLVFTITYFVIWFTVYLIVRKTSESFNEKLSK